MKKKLIALIALVAVLGGAIFAYVMLSAPVETAPGPASSSSPAETIYVLGGVPSPFVKEVRIQNELDSFTVVNNHENQIAMQNAPSPDFTIEGMPQEFLSQPSLKSIATTCGVLTASQRIPEGGDLAAFGLDTPRATVEAVYDTGDPATIKIGGDAPGGAGTYVLKDGSVYLVVTSSVSNMLRSRLSFADTQITSGENGADGQTPATMFTKITLGGTKFPEPVVVEEPLEQNEQTESLGVQSYRVTAPITAAADSGLPLQALASAFNLSGTEVVGLAGDADALAAHGLAEPYLTTEVDTADPEVGSFTLQISEANAEGIVFIRNENKPFIYSLPVASIPWYGYDLFDYMQKMLILPYIDSVSEVDVVVDGNMVYTFALEGEGKDITASVNGEELNADYFKKFYQTLISAAMEEELEEGTANPTGTPALQFVYRYRSGAEPDVVTFLPGPTRRYFVRLNDGPFYYTKSVYVDAVLEDIQKLLAGEEVKSYL